ncbi:MaoC/PaaZ C-terminal domain-containing protein [Alphaproteobacteria bacterium]|jgi:acyl dehydratase|nr:MaoC/PaaZ C-terminal domain-containing protein [Alphaproteobacteria bacterium]
MVEVSVGQELEPVVVGPITRHMLALYCGASGDHNPIHVDSDFAKAAGMGDVFAHGMLSMAFLGRVLTDWFPQEKIQEFEVRFTTVVRVEDVITATGKVISVTDGSAELEMLASNQNGDVVIKGRALVVVI